MKPYPFLFAALLGLAQCRTKDPDPADQLPPATQTGANTFGCLVNGQPYSPRGNNGFANYSVSYDTYPDGGLLQIGTYRIYGSGTNDFQSLSLWAQQIKGPSTFYLKDLKDKQTSIVRYNDRKANCFWRSADSTTTYRRGQLTITKLDLQAGVVSGTFWFTLYKPGCDSVRVTEGRFDKKL